MQAPTTLPRKVSGPPRLIALMLLLLVAGVGCTGAPLGQSDPVLEVVGTLQDVAGATSLEIALARCPNSSFLLVRVEGDSSPACLYFLDQFVRGEEIPFSVDVSAAVEPGWLAFDYRVPLEGRSHRALLNPVQRLFVNQGLRHGYGTDACRPVTFGSGGFDEGTVHPSKVLGSFVWTNY